MTQINAPQQQPVAQLAQGAQGVQGQQNDQANPPAALGTRHSIGHTIGRVALAIVSLGLSELVINIFKTHSANQARAAARLPENQPPVPTTPSILTINTSKADSLGSMMTIVDAGKARATTILGTLGTLDHAAFSTTLQKAIKNCPTEVTDAKLDELSEKVAREMLTQSIVRTIMDDDPLSASITAGKKSIMTDYYMQLPQVIALSNADTPEATEALLATAKDRVKVNLHNTANNIECKQTLFSAGIQKFAELTGLAPGSFKLETWPLENKLNIISSSKLNDQAAVEGKPYAVISKDDFMAAWQPKAETFFTSRAEAYNSLTAMDISEDLKTALKLQCLTSRDSIQSDTFTKSMEIATAMANNTSLNALLDPDLSDEDKINILETFATKQSLATIAAFENDRLLAMGPDERALITDISFRMIFDQRPALLTGLAQTPAVLASLEDVMQESVTNSMNTATSENYEAKERIFITDQTYQLLRLAVDEFAPQAVIA